MKTSGIKLAVDIFDDKWTALIINELLRDQLCFCDLERSLDGINPRTLSQRLDKLEQQKIVKKSLYCQRPARYRYGLTKKGTDLRKVLTAMTNWGAKHAR